MILCVQTFSNGNSGSNITIFITSCVHSSQSEYGFTSQLLAHMSLHCSYRVTSILILYFLLDLQEAYHQTVRVNSSDVLNLGSNSSTPSFVDRVIGSMRSDIHFATPEAKDNPDTTASTGLEDAQGQMSLDIYTPSTTEGHLEDRETACTGILRSSGFALNIGEPEEGPEQGGLTCTSAVWEDSTEILKVL